MRKLIRILLGLARCQGCGNYYDPTDGPCPNCSTQQ